MTDADDDLTYFTDVLKRLDALRARAPKDSVLFNRVTEARGSVGGLVGYFIADAAPAPVRTDE